MGGVNVDSGKGGKRSLDSEINMIPMIDLFMVTISFLLITAVWTHMARVNADAQVPGPPNPDKEQDDVPPEKQLHVYMTAADHFTLAWRQGATTVTSNDFPRKDNLVVDNGVKKIRYTDLADKITDEWKASGLHADAGDKKFAQAVLHTADDSPYVNIMAVIDAIYAPKRPFNSGSKTELVPAFNVTFSVRSD